MQSSINKYLTYNFLVRFGLGVIFIASALAAFFAPDEFIELIENSFVANLLPVSPETFVRVVISLNDFVVGLLLISGFATRRVAIWATAWLTGVMIVIGSPFDVLEHSGLLFMSIALVLNNQSGMKKHGYKDDKQLYQCPECHTWYTDEKWRDKCKTWCMEHHSCNLEIISHAAENK